jgi:Caspase domain
MLRVAIALLCLIFVSSSAARAEKRVALVIGNGEYENVGRLPNPTQDARAMAELFRASHFDVVDARQDLGVAAMRRALRDFSDHVRDADIAVVFYAGHGMEVSGTNYLVPVDAVLERDIDVEDEAVPLDRVMQLLEQAKLLRLVLLDACRDNPFMRSMKRTVSGRSIGRGLAQVDVLTSNTLVGFAAKAGSTAADGEGIDSPYTTALLNHLATPGLDLRLALGRVRDEVLRITANKQEPFLYGSLGGSEIALAPSSSHPEVVPAQPKRLEEPGKQVAVATPPRASGPAPFDGTWFASVACPALPGALPYELDFDVLIKDGVLHGEAGVKGKPGWRAIDGKIDPSGSGLIRERGLTGSSRYTGGDHPGTSYAFNLAVHLERVRGTGKRRSGRDCRYTFTKQ